tara:strand:+ start:1095 stop:1904 length:810 start_codon:yes stop_codon:yes gene_type:complete
VKRWKNILGKVAFVNCDPLYFELPEPWDILSAPPSWLTGHLLKRDCLIAPIPTADFAEYHDVLQLIPDLCIGSDGEVGSVILFGNRDPSLMRDIALPTDSATSRKLCMWVLKKLGFEPRPVDMGPDLQNMLNRCDGALLIGDRALDEAARNPELVRMDLGLAWKDLTGLPMVFAVYAARIDSPPDLIMEAHGMLNQQLTEFESNPSHRNRVIQSTSERSGFSTDRIAQYFHEIVARLDSQGQDGLDVFLRDVCNVSEYKVAQINPVSSS